MILIDKICKQIIINGRGQCLVSELYTSTLYVLNTGCPSMMEEEGSLCDKSTSVAEDSGRGANPVPGCQDP